MARSRGIDAPIRRRCATGDFAPPQARARPARRACARSIPWLRTDL
ncbi:hypothetical protein ISF6_5145 [Piscinibacter sakaiensis]|uniref:Uncharacterized protein n=1 Tax=Piscinibacter sakaiensis TaxID=1547922 RepID=A0A0K8P7I8_PISS1|nr:hypothetical protein ISF6_5145 [Piscinibacter sakaiensis]